MAKKTDQHPDRRSYLVRVREIIEYEITVPAGNVRDREDAKRAGEQVVKDETTHLRRVGKKPKGTQIKVTGYPKWKNRGPSETEQIAAAVKRIERNAVRRAKRKEAKE